MSNFIKQSSGIQLAQLATASAPASPVNGMMYYDSTLNKFQKYENGSWQSLGGGISLTTDVSGVLPIANGGTNSSAALSNNRVIQSSGGAIVEAAAITASRALISDANGIPTHSTVTSATLAFLDATSSVQTQINSKVAKAGDAMTGNLTFASTFGIDTTAAAGTLNIGATNATTINIGVAGATVNILGTLATVSTTNTEITDKLITLNKGGATASGGGSGLEFEENSSITGFVKVSAARTGFDLKAPATAGTATIITNASSFSYTLPGHSGTLMTDLVDDTTPQLGGELDVNGNAIASASNGNIVIAPHGTGRVRRAKQGALTRYVDEQYIDATALTASTTAVASDFTYDSTVYKSQFVDYQIVEATTFRRRIGRLMVVSDGNTGVASTVVSITDQSNESADVGVSWSAAMNGNNVELSYTTTANAKTMQSSVTRFLA